MRCHKVQGITEAFTDTLHSRAKTSSSVRQKAVFTAFLERDMQIYLCYRKKLPSCPAPCDSAPPPPESSCSRSSYQRFLVSKIKYTFPHAFPNTFRTARARARCALARIIDYLCSYAVVWHELSVQIMTFLRSVRPSRRATL